MFMKNGKIIAVANQKGGVAKTTSVRNIAYSLGELGKRVLAVDFDPQEFDSFFVDDSTLFIQRSQKLWMRKNCQIR